MWVFCGFGVNVAYIGVSICSLVLHGLCVQSVLASGYGCKGYECRVPAFALSAQLFGLWVVAAKVKA